MFSLISTLLNELIRYNFIYDNSELGDEAPGFASQEGSELMRSLGLLALTYSIFIYGFSFGMVWADGCPHMNIQ